MNSQRHCDESLLVQAPSLEPVRELRTPSAHSARQPPTPGRHSRSVQDSSQMWAMLRQCEPKAEAPQAPAVALQSLEGPRLSQLQAVLVQLEAQMSGCGGRDTGSEAKYYALSKKIQKVRAEILKAQREEEELVGVQKEKARILEEKALHSKRFGR